MKDSHVKILPTKYWDSERWAWEERRDTIPSRWTHIETDYQRETKLELN